MKMIGINMNINFSKIFETILPFIYMVIFIYLFSTVLFFFLPKSGVTFLDSNKAVLDYKRYEFYIKSSDMIDNKDFSIQNSTQTLDKYELKAIVSTKSGGLVIIEEKAGAKENLILSVGQKINGYLLKKVYKNHIVFTKNNQEYFLKIDDEKLTNFNSKNNNISSEHLDNNNNNNDIFIKDNIITISKMQKDTYLSNIEKIRNSIILTEVIGVGSVEGFRVERIMNDDFNKLELQEGDIIKTINSKKLSSYEDLSRSFDNIGNIRYISIEILRNNEIMGLNYEIN